MMMVKASKTVTLIAVVSFALCIGTGVLGIDVTRHEHGRNQLKTAMENTATGKNVQGAFDDDQTEMALHMSMVDAREGNAHNLTAERKYRDTLNGLKHLRDVAKRLQLQTQGSGQSHTLATELVDKIGALMNVGVQGAHLVRDETAFAALTGEKCMPRCLLDRLDRCVGQGVLLDQECTREAIHTCELRCRAGEKPKRDWSLLEQDQEKDPQQDQDKDQNQTTHQQQLGQQQQQQLGQEKTAKK